MYDRFGGNQSSSHELPLNGSHTPISLSFPASPEYGGGGRKVTMGGWEGGGGGGVVRVLETSTWRSDLQLFLQLARDFQVEDLRKRYW